MFTVDSADSVAAWITKSAPAIHWRHADGRSSTTSIGVVLKTNGWKLQCVKQTFA